MEVCPLTPNVGAEVVGLDLAEECSDDLVLALRAILLKYGVLVFRDQLSLTRDKQIKFASHFGELETYPAGEISHPRIIRLVHDADKPPTENIWHSDMSFRTTPPLGSLLRAIDIPRVGGDTIFADMRRAWACTSEGVRTIVRDLKAEHDIAKQSDSATAIRLREAVQPVQHPIIRIHPETREALLYVNFAYTTRVVGLSSADSAALLDHLFRYVSIPEIQCRIRWREGTVVFWDNRSLQHYAVGDYLPSQRIMERVTLVGDVPLSSSGAG